MLVQSISALPLACSPSGTWHRTRLDVGEQRLSDTPTVLHGRRAASTLRPATLGRVSQRRARAALRQDVSGYCHNLWSPRVWRAMHLEHLLAGIDCLLHCNLAKLLSHAAIADMCCAICNGLESDTICRLYEPRQAVI